MSGGGWCIILGRWGWVGHYFGWVEIGGKIFWVGGSGWGQVGIGDNAHSDFAFAVCNLTVQMLIHIKISLFSYSLSCL